jgi:hypothetical protein
MRVRAWAVEEMQPPVPARVTRQQSFAFEDRGGARRDERERAARQRREQRRAAAERRWGR